jgi:hypothetical protein
MNVGNYSFEGKCISEVHKRVDMGTYDECESCTVYETSGGKYVFNGRNDSGVFVASLNDEKGLFESIKSSTCTASVISSVSNQLYAKGLESFKELIPSPPRVIHVD